MYSKARCSFFNISSRLAVIAEILRVFKVLTFEFNGKSACTVHYHSWTRLRLLMASFLVDVVKLIS